MFYTKKINNNSLNKKNRSLILKFLFFFVLIFAILIGISFYWESNQPKLFYDYEKELGAQKENPTNWEVGSLILTIHDMERSITWSLNDKNENRLLKKSEIKQFIEELQEISRKNSQILKDIDLTLLDSEALFLLYSQLYEQGKSLVRLKKKVIEKIPYNYEESQKQFAYDQKKWEASCSETESIWEMNRWLTKWYKKFIEEKLRLEQNEKVPTHYIKPISVGSQRNQNFYWSDIANFKKLWEYRMKDDNGIEKNETVDLSQPLLIKFNGYGGFLNEEERKNSCENSSILGVTIFPKPITIRNNEKGIEFSIFYKNMLPIIIKLRKEIFFNRLGYNKWITFLNKDEGIRYLDISFGQVIETIAHELAHAVVTSLFGEYSGEYDGKGHGKIHDDFTKRIEAMMREDFDFYEFERWWKQKDGK
ncbi:MAG: hypothetical protein mread185_000286 [Mycoplasmataceae bacterium]|nr:MAG: hypothetical protein mread185_000286 [Mycoplasmataceae bacterium]